MIVPDWFKRELELIDKNYFCVWDGRKHRWIIRWWLVPHTKADERSYEDYKRKSSTVMVVAKRDEKDRDIGYHPLDQRVLYTLKRRKHLSEIPLSQILRMVDEANEKVRSDYEKEDEGLIRQAVETAWNARHRIWSI